MQLNLTDPDSILRWWRSFPERHWAYLDAFEASSPEFRGAIRAARLRIQADPLFDEARIAALSTQRRRWPVAVADWDDADMADEFEADAPAAPAWVDEELPVH